MKNLSSLLAAFGLAAAVCACSDPGTPSGPSSTSETAMDATVEELLRNPGDAEDDRMNLALYALAGGMVDAAGDASVLAAVFDQARRSPAREVSFAAVAARNDRFQPLIDQSLARQGEQNPRIRELGTTLRAVDERMAVRGVDYFPNLYVPNLDRADLSRAPIIVVGSEVSDLDEVPGWSLEGGAARTVLITEEAALASLAPVIVVNNATTHVEIVQGTDARGYAAAATAQAAPAGPVMQTSATDRDYRWTQYRINAGYHYESNSSKADLRFKLTFHNTGGGYLWGQNFMSGYYEASIGQVTKSQSNANTLFNTWKFLTPYPIALTSINQTPLLYVSTFEYDWYASGKAVSSCGALWTSSGFRHYPLMKYSQEWYAIICGVNTATVLPNQYSNYSFSTSKAFFTLHRNM